MKSLLLFLLTALAASLSAQPVSSIERQQTIDAALKLLHDEYLFPDVAEKMAKYVRSRTATYQVINDGSQLAGQLTTDLQTISHDRHLRVEFHPDGVPVGMLWKRDTSPAEREAERPMRHRSMLFNNFGIREVSVQKGNIGYLNLEYLAPPDEAGASYAAALGYLAQTDALILDLRQCGGSFSEDAAPFLCSYFFNKPTHLGTLHWRRNNQSRELWTQVRPAAERYVDKPIYILTSRGTFSGAEGMAYDLQHLKRAIVVGDTTVGGAHISGILRVNNRFSMLTPVGQAINPITSSNWEGTGVVPDTAVVTNRALYAAQRMALRHLQAQTYLVPEWREALKHIEEELVTQQPCAVRHVFRLAGFEDAREVRVAGSFNGWSDRDRPLVRRGNAWVGEVEVEPGKVTYKFIVDGRWLPDPANPRTEGQHANSVVEITAN